MSRVIWKYPVPFPAGAILMPIGSRLLALQLQDETPMLWVEVDAKQPEEELRRFRVIGTGHTFDPFGTYVGTYQQPPFVWHVYEETP